MLNADGVRDWLHEILDQEAARDHDEVSQAPLPTSLERVQRFRDAGIHTPLPGLVFKTADGEEFQVLVTQTRYARCRLAG